MLHQLNTTRLISFLPLAFAITGLACSDASSAAVEQHDGNELPDADASTVDSSTDDEDAWCDLPCDPLPDNERFCPSATVGECSAGFPYSFEVIARSSELGEGIRFVTLQDRLLLAETESGEPVVYAIPNGLFASQPRPMERIPFDPPPPEDMRGRFVAGSFAILCNAESCHAYKAEGEVNHPVFRPWPTPLPNDGRGIMGAFVRYDYELCVFGDGLHCAHEGEFENIADGAGGKFLAASPSFGNWLVGERGRAIRWSSTTDWDTKVRRVCVREIETGIDVNLYAVSEDGYGALALGDDGHVIALSPCEARVCKVEGREFSSVSVNAYGIRRFIDDASSELVESDFEGYCTRPLPIAPSYFFAPCVAYDNVWALSPDEIVGERRCLGPPP